MRIGLKLWSTNDDYRDCAENLFSRGIYDYIELMIVPGSAPEVRNWSSCSAPFILHAPHSYLGMNLAVPGKMNEKIRIFEEIEAFRQVLDASQIIFHPGLDGKSGEFIGQFLQLAEPYPKIRKAALIENKPALGLNNERCLGATPEEISEIISATGTGFCLDIGHAICSANFADRDWHEMLDEFLDLEPKIFHLSDGAVTSEKDMHLNYGSGDFDLDYILNWLPADASVSLETEKASENNLDDFVRDVEFVRTRRTA